jgi:hypothetical protein
MGKLRIRLNKVLTESIPLPTGNGHGHGNGHGNGHAAEPAAVTAGDQAELPAGQDATEEDGQGTTGA